MPRHTPETAAGERPVIYTAGTSSRSREEFLALLGHYGVGTVLDVRRFPSSRRFPHFNRPEMADWLAAAGIGYHYLGDELGGFRDGGYEEYTATPAFRSGFEHLTRLGAGAPAAVVCSEFLPWKCHRRFIADRLAAAGWRVVHLLDERRTYSPPPPAP